MPNFTTENVCYVKHGERQIMARVFKPEGAGPFPCFIDLHGGAWNNGDLADRTGIAGPAGVEASVKGVVMLWPVINPLSRYRNAIRASQLPNPPAFSIGMKEKHDTYWHTEAEMAEGNPMLLLERGEKVVMPPALW